LIVALIDSHLFDIVKAVELIAGALIMAGVVVPAALCVVMPVSTCALYWSVMLEHRPMGDVLALVAFALNGLLMLAHLQYYRGALQRHSVTVGEASGGPGSVFESVYAHPGGRTARGHFVAAVVTLLLVVLFYKYLVTGRTAQWCIAGLVIPGAILLARRLRDMGQSAWLLLPPLALMIAAFVKWLGIASMGSQLDTLLPMTALVVGAGFALWECLGATREASVQPAWQRVS
jgi:uncharacterized membrane protein YhaH (DUF805 family)